MKAEELYARELEKYHAMWDAGMWPALAEAVHYCHTVQIPLPEWLGLAVLNIIQDHYEIAPSVEGKGAYTIPKGRLTMDYAHFLRWRAMRAVLRAHGLTQLPDRKGRSAPGTATKAVLLKAAATRLREREQAKSARLRSDGEIGKSYELVEESRARGEARFTFDDLLTWGEMPG